MNHILNSPFYILNASTRSSKSEIAELAEHAELVHDHDLVVSARGELVNTRTRLAAEVAWLPGASPKKAAQVVAMLRDPAAVLVRDFGLAALAAVNAIASALQHVKQGPADLVKRGCERLVNDFQRVDVDEVMRDINEDRTIAGFPLLGDAGLVELEVAKLRRTYVQAMVAALDQLSTQDLVAVATSLAEESSGHGSNPMPPLISDLLEIYERKAGAFLEPEASDIESLISATEHRAKDGAEASEIDALTSRILERTKRWDTKAQPVQVLMQSRGLEHEVSVRLAMNLRGLAIGLFNQHNYLSISRRISDHLQVLFAEVPEVAERVQEDIEALTDIAESRRNEEAKSKRESAEFAASIAYETTFGRVFKDHFCLSIDGIRWKNNRISLEEVDGVSWGGVRGQHGTTFDIRIYSQQCDMFLEFNDESKFDAIVDRLWKAVGVRLLVDMLGALKDGKVHRFGTVSISDKGLVVDVTHLFRQSTNLFMPWSDVNKRMENGALVLSSMDGRSVGSVDLRAVKNAPVLTTALNLLWKKGSGTLSSVLVRNNDD